MEPCKGPFFFVPGNAKELTIDELFETRVSTLSYDINKRDKTAKIHSISTSKEFQCTGLAKSLFGYAFREMRLYHVKKAYLSWNGDTKSGELYRSLGFVPIDKEKHMEADLDSAVVHALCVKS